MFTQSNQENLIPLVLGDVRRLSSGTPHDLDDSLGLVAFGEETVLCNTPRPNTLRALAVAPVVGFLPIAEDTSRNEVVASEPVRKAGLRLWENGARHDVVHRGCMVATVVTYTRFVGGPCSCGSH